MKEIQISKFKATCLAVLEEVRATGEPVVVTRRGEKVARIVPERAGKAKDRNSWMGSWKGQGAIYDDLIEPASDESDWEAMRD